MRLSLGLIALAACSPVVAHTPDATTVDSSPDAPTHGMVTVKIYDVFNSGAVVVGTPVVFVEADGTEVGHPVTDATGVASADVHPGASASVVLKSGTNTRIQTLLGLKPGDNIILGPATPPSTDVGTFSVSFPTYSGATSYDVFGPCGSSNGTVSPITLTMRSDCKLDTMDLTVVPRDSSSTGLAYLTKSGVPFVASGTTSITGSYSGMAGFTATVTNLNAVITSVTVERRVPDNFGFFNEQNGTPTNGTVTLNAPGPAASRAQVETTVQKPGSIQVLIQGIAGNVQTYGLDAGMTLLPWVDTPAFDLANHKITMSTDTTGTTNDTPDVAFAEAEYSRTVNGTTTDFEWLIIGPAATDMTLPQLPVDVGDVMPKTTDTSGFLDAAMLEADGINGYDDIRLDVYKNINSATAPLHPTTMTKVRESLASAGGR
jgi:hypothetical protein